MIDLIGGPDRDRTDDLFHAMEARSQLRHRPTLICRNVCCNFFSVYYLAAFVNPCASQTVKLLAENDLAGMQVPFYTHCATLIRDGERRWQIFTGRK